MHQEPKKRSGRPEETVNLQIIVPSTCQNAVILPESSKDDIRFPAVFATSNRRANSCKPSRIIHFEKLKALLGHATEFPLCQVCLGAKGHSKRKDRVNRSQIPKISKQRRVAGAKNVQNSRFTRPFAISHKTSIHSFLSTGQLTT
jgi:hypothetical protein